MIRMSTILKVSKWLSPTTLHALYPWIKRDTLKAIYKRDRTINSTLDEIYGRKPCVNG